MASDKKGKRFKITKKYSDEPLEPYEMDQLMDILARLIARSYADDHPELFNLDSIKKNDDQNQGS